MSAPDRAAAKIAATEKFDLIEEQRRRLVVQEGRLPSWVQHLASGDRDQGGAINACEEF